MGIKSSEATCTSLYDRVRKLLVSYEWSDCTFSICGKDFKAHRLILGISSPVFEAMFYGPLSNSSNITVTDIEPNIFQLLLNYIYTDTAEITSIEDAFELLYASRKYLMEALSCKCIAYVQANISIDNVTAILNYPDFMQDKELISSAQKLFCEHASYLLKHNKKMITLPCMQTILESDEMNLNEKDLIKHIFDWTSLYCEQSRIPKSTENRRDILIKNGLFNLLRFFTLSIDDLAEIQADVNNLLLPMESAYIRKVITNRSNFIDDQNVDTNFLLTFTPRHTLKSQGYLCHRSSLRSVAPINIDPNNNTVYSKIKANKSVFITSLCIPTRMAPVLNFRNDTAKVYSEQISVSISDESDNSIFKVTNFINTVEYDSMVDIELSEPCFVKKNKWYQIRFSWPNNRYVTYSYVVEHRDIYYEDHKVTFEFQDLVVLPASNGSFLSGLRYCL